MEVELWHWFAFGVLVIVMLGLDLFVFHRHDHTPSLPESAGFTIFWIAVGLAFNAFVWWWGWQQHATHEAGLKFLSGYLVEKSLSMDNIFVFVVIFSFFSIPMMYQYRVLFWGILGAIVMRLGFILAGVELIENFHWVAPIFGVFLVYTAYRLARHRGGKVHPERNIVLRTARRFLPVTRGDHHQHGHRFLAVEGGRWCITPMLLVLLVIESTDVIFAIDSVPAIIGITHDRFIAFTSNIFAILGLRALYFLLAGVVQMFCYLHYGLAAVLGFVGLKMIAEWWAKLQGREHVVPAWVSLLVIVSLLGIAVIASVVVASRHHAAETESPDAP